MESEGDIVKIQLPPAHPALLLDDDNGVQCDLGNLVAFAFQPIDATEAKELGMSKFLASDARDCMQILMNEVLKVPITRSKTGDILGTLPKPSTVIPREKPIPKAKPPTRWEKYAQLKGIQKKKKDRKLWDETNQEWRPRFGYKRANDVSQDWLVEVKSSDPNPSENPYKRMEREKKERVQKQKKRERRNLTEASSEPAKSVSVSTAGITGKNLPQTTPHELGEKVKTVAKSTASMGKFNARLPMEPKHTRIEGKRKFDALVQSSGGNNKGKGNRGKANGKADAEHSSEKKRNLAVLDRVVKKSEGIDPSNVPERKVSAMQKKKWGKKNKDMPY